MTFEYSYTFKTLPAWEPGFYNSNFWVDKTVEDNFGGYQKETLAFCPKKIILKPYFYKAYSVNQLVGKNGGFAIWGYFLEKSLPFSVATWRLPNKFRELFLFSISEWIK